MAAKRKRDGGSADAEEVPAPEAAPEVAPAEAPTPACPFLDTIDRRALNFDFEKVCSVTVRNQKVYACLVCGKYLQGRGPSTPAHAHSSQEGHFVFINLSDGSVHCLPDNYEVRDPSLEDIQHNLRPTFSKETIARLDQDAKPRRDVFGLEYLPGYGPMNDLPRSDFLNATVQALGNVPPLRDFFLDARNFGDATSPVVRHFGGLMCKLWNDRKLKAAVSAHELMQAVTRASKGRFRLGAQADCAAFLKWLLHELHVGLGGTHKPGSSVIHRCFLGRVRVETSVQEGDKPPSAWEAREVPALMLALDLPTSPIFKDSKDGTSLVPTLAMSEALAKFDGTHVSESARAGKLLRSRYRLVKLPPFALVHINRLTKTARGLEKNRTIVPLVVDGLDLSPYAVAPEAAVAPARSAVYDLVANVVQRTDHDVAKDKGKAVDDVLQTATHVVHLRNRAARSWLELQGPHVSRIMPQQIPRAESLWAVFEARAAERKAGEA